MNKITTTAGFFALGAASLHAAVNAPMVGSVEAQKPWSISATLRGFYDDNYATAPKFLKRDSYGFEVSPSAALNLVREQTTFGLNYTYDLRWYDDRRDHKDDQSHLVNAKLSHAFTERYKADVSDSFVVAQEPTILDPNQVITVPLRTEGDNMRNTVSASFSAGLTENTDVVLGYTNNWYDYDQRGVGSRSALLDRVENYGRIDLRQVLLPTTVGVIGYQFGAVDYNSPDPIGVFLTPTGFALIPADVRDSYHHYMYIGVDQSITSQLNASVRVGAEYTDYHERKKILGTEDNQWGPYADANATWTYMPRSYVQLGVRHQRAATDVGFLGGTTPTQDMEATTVYASLNHQIASKLVGSIVGTYQHSTFEAGAANNLADDFFLAGINLTYEINKFLAAEVGYNYDRLDSELSKIGVPRSYTRNRVYIGIRASY
jgi:hypothetical protein